MVDYYRYKNLLEELENSELEKYPVPGDTYGSLLCTYLILDDFNNVKFVWSRIPSQVKESHPELSELWELSKKLIKRELNSFHRFLNTNKWPSYLQSFITDLKAHVIDRYLNLVSRAFSCISADDVAKMTDMEVSSVIKIAESRNWVYDSSNGMLIVSDSGLSKVGKPHEASLAQLTDYVTFLEN